MRYMRESGERTPFLDKKQPFGGELVFWLKLGGEKNAGSTIGRFFKKRHANGRHLPLLFYLIKYSSLLLILIGVYMA